MHIQVAVDCSLSGFRGNLPFISRSCVTNIQFAALNRRRFVSCYRRRRRRRHSITQQHNVVINSSISFSLSLFLFYCFFFLFQGEFRRLSVVSIRLNRINLNCFVFFLFVFFFGSKWLHLHLVRLNEAKGEIDGNFRLIFNLISF